MRAKGHMVSGLALALAGAFGAVMVSGWVGAQDAPESLLPPGFDEPAPAPAPTATPAPLPTAAPAPGIAPTVAPPTAPPTAPSTTGPTAPDETARDAAVNEAGAPPFAQLPPVPQMSDAELAQLPSLEELEELSVDELDDLLGLKPKFDIPPAARRSLGQVGVLAVDEGGFATLSLAGQPASLVRATLAGTRGPLVSRWGHILMRRALASRYRAPEGMEPAEFAALRAGVLNALGEYNVARALVQDVDTGNWNEALTDEALTAYIAGNDVVGMCPAVRLQGSARDDAQWVMLQAICNAYAGEGALAGSQLNSAQAEEIAPEIDLLLAQRFAGAAGRGRRGTSVTWDGVDTLTPWRFSLANAVGETIPEGLLGDALAGEGALYYQLAGANAPGLPLDQRAPYAQTAAQYGVFSAKALIGLYSQLYSDNSGRGDTAQRAARLREAYTAIDPATRISAMRDIWDEAKLGYSSQILTAYAAARIPAAPAYADNADDLIASMLTAGLDRDAAAWRTIVDPGSLGWALAVLADPAGGATSGEGFDAFVSDDDSAGQRKSAFLAAGLAGLDRLPGSDITALGAQLGVDFDRQTRWTGMIEKAANVDNPALVALLAGLGMQGSDWSQMTPLHLYHITSALNRVGLEAEARMIAAEAVARG